jgi:hypothetical protein
MASKTLSSTEPSIPVVAVLTKMLVVENW